MITDVIIGGNDAIDGEVVRVDSFPDTMLVVDLGGGMCRLGRADYIVDLLSYDGSRQYAVRGASDRCPPERWITADLCDGMPYFTDKQFGYSFCSQTVEDVRDPVGLVRELSRISWSGFISTIHWTDELNALAGGPIGYWHHRWVVGVKDDSVLEFVYKPPFVHFDTEDRTTGRGMLHIKWETDIATREVMYSGVPKRKDFVAFIRDRWG